MTDYDGTYDSSTAKEVTLQKIISIFSDLGASKLYVKSLAPNDNSKNQPYFGPHLTDLAFLPTGELVPSVTKSVKTKDAKRQIKYQASLNLSWVNAEGNIHPAPNAKLIYYPQYPEVRFSGFLQGSKIKASEWMDPYKRGRSEGRWLILGVSSQGVIYSYLVTPECALSKELAQTDFIKISNIFGQIDIDHKISGTSTKDALIDKLLEIHNMGWIPSQKLNADMSSSPYKAQNGGGYTLEAKLGVTPNGFAEPDFLGWEVKQFGVTKFPRTGARPTTLMTPEPDGGFYKAQGVAEFVKTYGYPDKSGKKDRLNFGGKHVSSIANVSTGLTLEIIGFDTETARITDAGGTISLLDNSDRITASWSFAKIMGHWKRKHAQAVYIPCLKRTSESGGHEYHYGNNIELGIGTDFELLLSSIAEGNVFYDPGIKLEYASTDKPKLKRRSQFRVNHKNIGSLYKSFEYTDISGTS